MRGLHSILLVSLCILSADSSAATLRVVTTAGGNTDPIPARLYLAGPGGESIVQTEESWPTFQTHVSSAGTATFQVSPGAYNLTVERGPEWAPVRRTVEISAENEIENVHVNLERLVNMANEGWWSGEMHIHRPIEQAEVLMRAEDLHFGQFLSWWNATSPWLETPVPNPATITFDGNRAAHLIGGEDERDGGALLFFNLDRPVDITAGRQHFPSSLVYARQVQAAGGWTDIEKPFWWDVPMWIANGIGDSIGIANNHHYRHAMLETEAWGRPRNVERLPPPQGNGWWTQEIYHHLLNCGIRIPPSAGSASGVLPNPVGYNRAYVKIEGEPTMEKWFGGLKAGRVFVTNGPLLRVNASGQPPGHVFRTKEHHVFLQINTQLDSNDPIERLELVHNGEARPIGSSEWVAFHESGWFLVRAITSLSNTLRFASTAPFYVEVGDNTIPPQQHESAQFFVEWCEERIATLEANSALTAAQRDQVLQPWQRALTFWNEKKDAAPAMTELRGEVVDEDTGEAIAARVYLKKPNNGWAFVESSVPDGSAVRYEQRNWLDHAAEEFHTTVSAHPFETQLPPGRYELIVERGKEYVPSTNIVEIADHPVEVSVPLKRWINMAERGWFSGDTHVHRSLQDLPNIMLAEDLNVAFPLTYWVTHAFRPPTSGDKSSTGAIPGELIRLDDTHVIWPRNTEWEIFSVGARRHTLGAVFALGHEQPFEEGVPTVRNVAAEARRQDALLDLDKHDWPWSMTLPPTMGVQLYELSNNHVWRTRFAFTNWNSETPPAMRPPLREKSGNEREWIFFTMANYHTLLNCGLKMVPTAGTASGVHPVPLGFGRVYVHQPNGFDYEGWKDGLAAGRSFVTTGPMVFAELNGKPLGHHFESVGWFKATINGKILSEQPLSFAEIIHDGQPVRTIMGANERTELGAYRTIFQTEIELPETGWLAVRCWEDRPGGRVRFAHTSPWHVRVDGEEIRAPKADRDYLMARVRTEIERSRDILPPEAIAEYEEALRYYESRPVRDESDRSDRGDAFDAADWKGVPGRVHIAPYPGGRHPRIGFLDGALEPQRETKVNVFTPWDPESYVVIDVPEAIWSNLGLTYLAHTHIDTIWSARGAELPELEWTRNEDGSLTHERILPNGIAFGTKVVARERHAEMELWLKNGTEEPLTDLRIQNCVMLKGAAGFNAQSNWNKRLDSSFAMVHSDDQTRWIVTAWESCDRTWANPPVPCIHSDPRFPDLAPGETGRLRGWLWFHEGDSIEESLEKFAAEME